jgi:hypothetical protein
VALPNPIKDEPRGRFKEHAGSEFGCRPSIYRRLISSQWLFVVGIQSWEPISSIPAGCCLTLGYSIFMYSVGDSHAFAGYHPI